MRIDPLSRDEESDVTLRITTESEARFPALLRLEGSLGAEVAAVLERECSGVLRSHGAVSIDLAGVNFVDRAGVEALKRLSRAGVEIRCRPGAVTSVLEGARVRVTLVDDEVGHGRP